MLEELDGAGWGRSGRAKTGTGAHQTGTGTGTRDGPPPVAVRGHSGRMALRSRGAVHASLRCGARHEHIAKAAFDVNIRRASYFLDIHEEAQQGAGAPSLPYRELPRGAVVFAVGALDAYLSEVSAEVIVRDLESAVAPTETREVLKRVQAEVPTLSLEIAVLRRQAPMARQGAMDSGASGSWHSMSTSSGPPSSQYVCWVKPKLAG